MDLKDFNYDSFSNYELVCLIESVKNYLAENNKREHSTLKDLLLLLEIEFRHRK